MATTQGTRKHRPDRTAPGQNIRVGVGIEPDVTDRCKATHDVPWSERCVLERWHDVASPSMQTMGTKHRDKRGDEW